MEKVLEKAILEGRKAGDQKLQELMNQGAKWVVRDGSRVVGTMLDLCGFAHVHISGRNNLVTYIKKHGRKEEWASDWQLETPYGKVRIYKGYRGGYELYLPIELGRQEISVKTSAYERALEVLAEAGVDGYVVSRLD